MSEIVKGLNVKYYLIYTLTIVFTFTGYFLDFSNYLPIISTDSYLQILPIIVVVLSVLFLVAGFLIFELKKKSIAGIDDKWEQSRTYIRYAGYRLYLIGVCLLIGIPVFYLTKNSIVLYTIALAAISLIICKPSENKVENDLNI